jgi:hypothetical protein
MAFDMRRLCVLLGIASVLLSAGCGASASVSGGVISDNAGYLTAWKQGWTAVEQASAPYIPTATSPGVCNKGGAKVACYETDSHVAANLVRLQQSLQAANVPGPYATANTMTRRAISAELRGLALRMHSLEAGDYTEAEREGWFLEAKALMKEAKALAQQGYASFPQWARPAPAPII